MQGNQFLKKQSVKFEKEEKRNDKAWKDFTPKKRKRMLPDLKITRIHRPRGYVWDKGGKIEESYETSSFLLYSPFISLHIVSKKNKKILPTKHTIKSFV